MEFFRVGMMENNVRDLYGVAEDNASANSVVSRIITSHLLFCICGLHVSSVCDLLFVDTCELHEAIICELHVWTALPMTCL